MLVGVGAVVLDGGRVLLVKRGQEPLKGEWALPGGRLELGETLTEGVVREVLEETGLQVRPIAHVETVERISRDGDGRVQYHYVLVDWLCKLDGGELCCGDDAEDARWWPLEDVRSGAVELRAFTRAVIEKAAGLPG